MKASMAGFNLWGAQQTLYQALHQNVHMYAFLVSPRQTFPKLTTEHSWTNTISTGGRRKLLNSSLMNKLIRIEWVSEWLSEWLSERSPFDCLLRSWMLRIYVTSMSKKAVPQMHSFGSLKKHLQPEAIPYILSKLTTELCPGNLSLTHFYIQDTREDNNGLPVVVDWYLRMHRCFHRMYVTKNCLKSCTEKKWMWAEFYPKKGPRDRYKLPGTQHFTPFKMDSKIWRENREILVSYLESRWSVLVAAKGCSRFVFVASRFETH